MYFFFFTFNEFACIFTVTVNKSLFSADSPNNNVLIFSQLLIIIFSHETQWDRLEPFRGVEFIAFGGVECIALTQRIHADKSKIQYYEGGKFLVMIEPPDEKVWFFKATLGLLLCSLYLKVTTLENILVWIWNTCIIMNHFSACCIVKLFKI